MEPLRLTEEVFFSPIMPILTPYAMDLCMHLIGYGYIPKPIVYPVVPKVQERVRLCVHTFNSLGEIDELVRRIEEWLVKLTDTVAKL